MNSQIRDDVAMYPFNKTKVLLYQGHHVLYSNKGLMSDYFILVNDLLSFNAMTSKYKDM